MTYPALKYTIEIKLYCSLLVRVDKSQKGLSDKEVCLAFKMTGDHRVKVDESEVIGEQRPICER